MCGIDGGFPKPFAFKTALPLLLAIAFLGVPKPALCQEDSQSNAPFDAAAVFGPPAAVHGIVKNALTGEPLPRALVLVGGQAGTGALTDSDGHFEFSGVIMGPNAFEVTKPGFEDAAGVPAGVTLRDLRGFTHNVFVTANTPELVFTLRPTNSIRGQIELSTGDPAQNNGITLLRREIQNGRAVWRPHASARAGADGSYHFAHLQDGDYAVVAEPAPEADLVTRPELADADRDVTWNWYPRVYYPDAQDFGGAARIHLTGGEQANPNLMLPLEPFHPVRATVLLPGELKNNSSPAGVQFETLGTDGHHVPYPGVYDGKTNSVDTMLPDGNYVLRVSASRSETASFGNRSWHFRQAPSLTGQVAFTVNGHALTKLRLSVGPQTPTPLVIDLTRTSPPAAIESPNRGQVFVEITQASPLTDGMQSIFAQGSGPGSLDTVPPSPGRYWVHTIVADPTLCESSFTAGGANLGREPLVVSDSGATAPLTLSLRDDCASLKVSLPPSLAGMAAGEETAYTVYVVPDFDFTTEAPSRTLRASSGSTITFGSLTPGSYHVFAFPAPVDLEYHNREVLAGLPGQAITLAPGGSQDLVLEVPGQ